MLALVALYSAACVIISMAACIETGAAAAGAFLNGQFLAKCPTSSHSKHLWFLYGKLGGFMSLLPAVVLLPVFGAALDPAVPFGLGVLLLLRPPVGAPLI